MTEEQEDLTQDEELEVPDFAEPERIESSCDNNEDPSPSGSVHKLEGGFIMSKEEKVRNQPQCIYEDLCIAFGNCCECCKVFTDPIRRERFGYQLETVTCECHDICVQEVKAICTKEFTHKIMIPGVDGVI